MKNMENKSYFEQEDVINLIEHTELTENILKQIKVNDLNLITEEYLIKNEIDNYPYDYSFG